MTIRNPLRSRALLLSGLAFIAGSTCTRAQSPALVIVTKSVGEYAMYIVDPATKKISGRVPIVGGGESHEVTVSADGRLAFVSDILDPERGEMSAANPKGTKSDFISVIDVAARKEISHVETGIGSAPHDMVFIGGKLYFTSEGYKLVGRYDPDSNRIDWMCGTAQDRTHMLTVSKDGRNIFTSNSDSNSVSALALGPGRGSKSHLEGNFSNHDDPNGYWRVTTIPVGHGPEGIAMTPDEREAWVLTRGDGGVSIIDVATKKVLQTLKLSIENPVRIKFTPDGRQAVIADFYSGAVLVLDVRARQEIKRIQIGTKDNKVTLMNGVPFASDNQIHSLLITPDGSRAYLTVFASRYVAIIDLKTLEVEDSRIPIAGQPESVAWVSAK